MSNNNLKFQLRSKSIAEFEDTWGSCMSVSQHVTVMNHASGNIWR